MMGRGQLEAMQILMRDCGITDGSPRELLLKRQELIITGLKRRPIKMMPGLMMILGMFKDRLKLAVATSAPRAFTELTLPKLGLEQFFGVIQTGDEIVNGKPDPEIYLKTMTRLGMSPDQCVVLEDSRAGSLAGHHAGAKVISVPSELTASEDFSFADARVSNLFEAAEVVKSWMSEN
jgi:HAD superfamily hydrolase (TIGR01509 family)